jgi:predicted RecA/RadA family phage recombinase
MAGARDRNFKVLDDWGHHVRFLVGSTAVSEGDMLVLASNAATEIADSCTTGAIGVAGDDAAAGEYVTVLTAGLFEGTADTGVNFNFGDRVYAASATALDAGTAGDVPIGYVAHVDPASAGAVKFVLWSSVENEIDARS